MERKITLVYTAKGIELTYRGELVVLVMQETVHIDGVGTFTFAYQTAGVKAGIAWRKPDQQWLDNFILHFNEPKCHYYTPVTKILALSVSKRVAA